MELTGQLLIAMPDMNDPRFARSVIFLCSYSSDAAMGLIVNKPAGETYFSHLLQQLDIEIESPVVERAQVYFGGPVDSGRGMVLHSRDYNNAKQTIKVGNEYSLTASFDVLKDLAMGRGPEKWLVVLGYAGWGKGQLDKELIRNDWLVADASTGLVFDLDDHIKWAEAMKTIGIDPLMLSASTGRA